METPEFPPNSEASRRLGEEREVRRITQGQPIRKKRSLRKRFTESFIAGDLKTALTYAVMDVLLLEARDVVIDTIHSGVERLFRGDSYRYRGVNRPQTGPYGNVQYNMMSRPSPMTGPARAMSRQARARHDFDELILDSRTEAEEVIDRLFDLVSRYDTATVADLYELVGLASNHTDHKWGWTDLRGAGVTRTRDGYLLDLPDPSPLR